MATLALHQPYKQNDSLINKGICPPSEGLWVSIRAGSLTFRQSRKLASTWQRIWQWAVLSPHFSVASNLSLMCDSALQFESILLVQPRSVPSARRTAYSRQRRWLPEGGWNPGLRGTWLPGRKQSFSSARERWGVCYCSRAHQKPMTLRLH